MLGADASSTLFVYPSNGASNVHNLSGSIDCRFGWPPEASYSLHTQALGVAVSAAVRGSDKLAFAVAPGITVILMLFGKWPLCWEPSPGSPGSAGPTAVPARPNGLAFITLCSHLLCRRFLCRHRFHTGR